MPGTAFLGSSGQTGSGPQVGVAQTFQAEVPTKIISTGWASSWRAPVLLTVPKEAEAAGETAGMKEALISTFLQG